MEGHAGEGFLEVYMISSIVWLYFVYSGKAGEGIEPWIIYLPVVFVEMFVYLKFVLPKIGDKIFGETIHEK